MVRIRVLLFMPPPWQIADLSVSRRPNLWRTMSLKEGWGISPRRRTITVVAGYFSRSGLRRLPPVLPTVRAFQEAQGGIVRLVGSAHQLERLVTGQMDSDAAAGSDRNFSVAIAMPAPATVHTSFP
jgi:hypothetical protein